MMSEAVSVRERTYSLKQLQLLRDCLESNKDASEPLTSSLMAFSSYLTEDDSNDMLFWLRFAEQIYRDSGYPERQFAKKLFAQFEIREDGGGHKPQRS
jgi:hypothetical protein